VVAGEKGKHLPNVDPLKDINRPTGPPEGEGFLLKQPGDVCEDSCDGAVLVLDTHSERVQHFGGDGAPADTLIPVRASAGQGKTQQQDAIKNPRAVLSCADGSLVLCDTWSHRVLRFPPTASSSEAGARGELAAPTLLAGVPNSCGKQPDQLAFPSGAAFAKDGSLLVADTNNHRIQRFGVGELTGITVAGNSGGKSGAGLGELNMPTGICVDPRDGSFLVADRANSRVLRFPAGSCAGDPGEVIVDNDTLQRPWGVCIDVNGALYVSDERCGFVLKFELGASCSGGGDQGAAAAPARAAQKVPTDNPMELD
jgi:sugar lactone lactonase YvrE